MSAATKPTRDAVMEGQPNRPEFSEDATALFQHGIERIGQAQKQLIDVAVQHNRETVEVLKKVSAEAPSGSRLPMLDLICDAVSRYADIQKSTVDFFVEQNRIWTDVFKDRTGNVKKSGESAGNAIKKTMESSFAVQKKAFEHTAAQAKAVVNAARDQFGLSGTQADVVTDTFRRSVDTIVEAQKELLNIAIH